MEIWDQIIQLASSPSINLLLGTIGALRQKLSDHLDEVIRTTTGRFPDLESTEAVLRAWTASEAYLSLWNRVVVGEREPDDLIVDEFIEASGFFLPDESELRIRAREIVVAFVDELANAIYNSNEGVSLLAGRMETLHAEAREDMRVILRVVEEINSTRPSFEVATSIPDVPASSASPLSSEDEKLVGKTDSARDLLNRGFVRTARTELEQVRGEVSESSSYLRFRVLTNLAACALAEEDTETASNLLEQAFLTNPENIRGIANVALAAHLKGDSDRAKLLANEVLSRAPNDPQATSILIVELSRHDTTDELDAYVSQNDWLTTDKTCGLALAGIRSDQSRYEDAIELCETLVEAYSDDPDTHLALAEHLIYSHRQGAPATTFSREAREHYEEIVKETTVALGLLEDTQLERRKARALYARGCARALLGQSETALSDLDGVLAIEPANVDAIYNKGLVLFNEGRYEKARTLLEQVTESGRKAEARLILADIAFISDDPEAAVTLLDGTLALERMNWDDMHRAQMLRRSELASKSVDTVGPAVYEALGHNSADPKLLVLAAFCREQDGDFAEAETLLLKASKDADELDAQTVAFYLARFYDNLARYSDAADHYATVVDKDATHPSALSLLRCLSNAGRLGEALAWAKEIQNQVQDVPRPVIEVEGHILELAGDLAGSIGCIQALCARPDTGPSDRVWLARILYRHGDEDAAREMASSINPKHLYEYPKELMSLAQLKQLLGVPGVLEDAYQARRHGMGDAAVQLAYFTIFVDYEDDVPNLEVAGPGTVVRLKGDSREESWYITDDQDDPRGAHELAVNDSLAQKLAGKRAGESIILQEDIEDLTYEVVGIQSKHVQAFQDTANDFSTRFPDDKSISRVDISVDEISGMLRILDSRYRVVRNREAVYREGLLPFTSFAARLGVSLVELWAACTQERFTQVRFSMGLEDDRIQDASPFDGAECLILDTVSLLTIQELGLHDAVHNQFNRVAVPQAVIDGLHQAHALAVSGKAPSGWVSKSYDGAYMYRDANSDELAKRNEFLGHTLNFARSFDRIASYPLLNNKNREELIDLLSPIGAGTAFAGDGISSDGSLLLCDDLELARFARSESIRSVNTQKLLSYLLTQGAITAEEHAAAVEKLVRLNYWFVKVGPQDIVIRLKANNYQTTEGVRGMFATLEGPHCTEDSAVGVLAAVMLSVMIEAPREQRNILASLVIATLQHGRELSPILYKFRESVRLRLGSVPHLREELLETINLHIRLPL